MALAPVGVSRVPLFKDLTSGFNGGSRNASLVVVLNSASLRKCIACSAIQESSTPIASPETKEAKPEAKATPTASSPETKEAKAAPAKPKPAAKAPAKALGEMMEEDVIPALQAILEAQDDITDLDLFFKDNRLEGSFMQNDIPYSFWAFFPDGVLTGPKGFAISSYGSEVSTIEPFLIDEKKITGKQVVFWVEKRLTAQGIIPVSNYY